MGQVCGLALNPAPSFAGFCSAHHYAKWHLAICEEGVIGYFRWGNVLRA